MSLYPSLEDMKVDQMARAQISALQAAQAQQQQHEQQHQQPPVNYPQYQPPQSYPQYPPPPTYPQHQEQPQQHEQQQPPRNPSPDSKFVYPVLTEYMGLDLPPEFLNQYVPYTPPALPTPTSPSSPIPQNEVAVLPPSQVALPRTSTGLVAPLSCTSVGLKRAEVTHGIREVKLCKDKDGKVGLRVKDVNKGVFVALVQKNSPAALVGLRFGDQILQINGENVAGYNVSKVHGMFGKLPANGITLSIRDRPFERTVTLHKDSTGHIGFGYKNGKITLLVKDSSAARNGLLTEHQLLEVNGQNVVGLKDKEITNIIEGGGKIITVTIMPTFLYEHMIKHMRSSLVKNVMDHSIPDL